MRSYISVTQLQTSLPHRCMTCNVLYCSELEILVSRVLQDGGIPPQDVAVNKRLYCCVLHVHMSVHTWDISSQHLEQRHLSPGTTRTTCPTVRTSVGWGGCFVISVLRDSAEESLHQLLYQTVLPQQPTEHVMSAAAHSSTTQISVRRHLQTSSRSSAHFAQRLVNQGAADRTTPAQRRRVFLEYTELKGA